MHGSPASAREHAGSCARHRRGSDGCGRKVRPHRCAMRHRRADVRRVVRQRHPMKDRVFFAVASLPQCRLRARRSEKGLRPAAAHRHEQGRRRAAHRRGSADQCAHHHRGRWLVRHARGFLRGYPRRLTRNLMAKSFSVLGMPRAQRVADGYSPGAARWAWPAAMCWQSGGSDGAARRAPAAESRFGLASTMPARLSP